MEQLLSSPESVVAVVVGLFTTRLTNILKVYIQRIIPGNSNEAEQARKGVVEGFVLIVAALLSYSLSLLLSYTQTNLDVRLTAVVAFLISQGLYFARKS